MAYIMPLEFLNSGYGKTVKEVLDTLWLNYEVERFCSDVVAGECPLIEGDSVRFEGISADDIVLQDCGGLNFCGLGVLGEGVPELKESVSAGFDVVVEDVDAVE